MIDETFHLYMMRTFIHTLFAANMKPQSHIVMFYTFTFDA